MTGDAKTILLLVLLVLTACADEGPRFNQESAGLPPPPATSARIFVYRDFAIYQGLEWVPVFFNSTTIAVVVRGFALHNGMVDNTLLFPTADVRPLPL
jgi:hypothetical protein